MVLGNVSYAVDAVSLLLIGSLVRKSAAAECRWGRGYATRRVSRSAALAALEVQHGHAPAGVL